MLRRLHGGGGDELGLEGSRVGLELGEREGTPGANEKKASGTGG